MRRVTAVAFLSFVTLMIVDAGAQVTVGAALALGQSHQDAGASDLPSR